MNNQGHCFLSKLVQMCWSERWKFCFI